MATVVQTSAGVTGTGTAVTTTFGGATGTGNGLVVLVAYAQPNLTSISDSAGNTYLLAKSANFFGVQYDSIYYCANPTGGLLAVTANFSASTSVTGLVAVEVVGRLTLGNVNGAAVNSQNPTPGAIDVSARQIAFVGVNKSGSFITAPSGFTNAHIAPDAGAAYKLYTNDADAQNPQWTTTASTPNSCTIAAFSSTYVSPPGGLAPAFAVRPAEPASPWSRPFAVQAVRSTPYPAPASPTPAPPAYAPAFAVMPLRPGSPLAQPFPVQAVFSNPYPVLPPPPFTPPPFTPPASMPGGPLARPFLIPLVQGTPVTPAPVPVKVYAPVVPGPPLTGALGVLRLLVPPLSPTVVVAPPAAVPGPAVYAPAFAFGPPLVGPFGLRRAAVPSTRPPITPAPVSSRPQSYAPALVGGPPIPGAPWRMRQGPTFPRALTRPAPPAVVFPAVKKKPFLSRVPDAQADPRRAARQTEILHSMVNSLIAQGLIVQTGGSEWTLRSGGFVATRAPTSADDETKGAVVGVTWVNAQTEQFYVCTKNAKGAARWKLLS